MSKKLKMSLVATALILSANSFAVKVSDIEVANLEGLTKDFVLQHIPVAVGTEYNEESLNAIRNSLLQTGLITDVKVTPTVTRKDAKLIIEVMEIENAREVKAAIDEASKRTDLVVNSLQVVGNKHIGVSDIVNKSNIVKGDYFTPITVNYLAQALFNTGNFNNVVPEVNRNAANKSVDIKITLTENPIIKSVKLEGITAFKKEDLINAARLNKGLVFNSYSIHPELSPIIEAYRKNGLITARIDNAEVTQDGDVYIKVSEGVVTKVKYAKKVISKDNKRLSEKKFKLKTKDYIFDRMTYIKEGDFLTESAITKTMQEYFKTGLFNSIEPLIEGDEKDPNGRVVTFLVEERPVMSINGQVSYETKEGWTGGVTYSDLNFLGTQKDISFQTNFGTRGNFELSASYFDPWIKGTDKLQLGTSIFFKREKVKKADLMKDSSFSEKENDKIKTIAIPYTLANITRYSSLYSYGGSITLGKGFKHNIFLTAKPRVYGAYAKNAVNINQLEGKSVKPQVLIDYTLGAVSLGISYDTRDDAYLPKNGFYINANLEGGYIFREKSITSKELSKVNGEIQKYSKNMFSDGNDDNTVVEAKKKLDKAEKGKDQKAIADAKKDYDKAISKYLTKNNIPTIDEKATLKTRPYYIAKLDARAYHKIIKDKNSMAYRLLVGFAGKGTPENLLFDTSDGTTLRGYNNETASAMIMGTIENRTYIGNYVQLVVFADAGVHNRQKLDDKNNNIFYEEGKYEGMKKYTPIKDMFKKENFKADIGVGARVTTPLGILRFDYAWPLVNKGDNTKGKFTFGFGQTF